MRILSLAPLAGPGLDRLRALGDLELDPWIEHAPIKLHAAGELLERLQGIDVLIVEADHVPAEVIDGSSLRIIGVCRGDPTNVDVRAATARGVAVVRAPGRNAGGVAELAIGLMLALLRDIVAADQDIRAGRWFVDEKIPQQRHGGRELRGSTVGLVGFGAVGRATGERLLALGARVLAYDPAVDASEVKEAGAEPAATLGELMERSDIISVHAPLNEHTRGLIGADAFARARPGTLLVNTARFGIVDEGALLDALRDGRLGGAAFDHFTDEYLAPEHPLAGMPNVVLTPHLGGATRETVEAHTTMMADGIEAVLRGEAPPTLVDESVMRAR